MTPWLASHIRRWHANPALAHIPDTLGGHGGRMGILALQIWGDGASRELLAACLCHDLGEYATGDVPKPAKADPTLRSALTRLEDAALHKLGMSYSLSAEDQRRLKYLDVLDAYLWCELHRPDLLDRDGWPDDRAWLDAEKADLERKAA